MRRILPLAAALSVIAALVWAFLPRPVEVDLDRVALRPLEVTVEEEGEARIREVFTVSATLAGKLQRIALHPGDEVRQGDPVASIGPAASGLLDSRSRAVAEATAAAAQAATDLARALVAQAEASRDYAASEVSRATALFQKGAVSARAYDNAVRDQKTAQAAVSSALANLAVREKELESALAVLKPDGGAGRCCVDILAPVSGRVLRVLTESEQVVQPGTPILELGDPGSLEVVVDLLSRDAVRVVKGASASITGWGGPAIAAKVERVEPSAVTRVSALGIEEQRVTVILALEGDAKDWAQLGHGFRVIARIAIWREDGVLTIPVGALFRDGSDWATYVAREGRAVVTHVELGERNQDYAQVLKGLEAGDEVILHPSDQVSPGVKVVAVADGT